MGAQLGEVADQDPDQFALAVPEAGEQFAFFFGRQQVGGEDRLRRVDGNSDPLAPVLRRFAGLVFIAVLPLLKRGSRATLRVSPGRFSLPRGKAANRTSDQAREWEGDRPSWCRCTIAPSRFFNVPDRSTEKS